MQIHDGELPRRANVEAEVILLENQVLTVRPSFQLEQVASEMIRARRIAPRGWSGRGSAVDQQARTYPAKNCIFEHRARATRFGWPVRAALQKALP
jgi:hypothetical protein